MRVDFTRHASQVVKWSRSSDSSLMLVEESAFGGETM